jgi:hypothetical protein
MAQDPDMRRRVIRAVDTAFRDVHTRRMAQWATDDSVPMPTRDESRRIAEHEVGALIRALGPLAAWKPERYDQERSWVAERLAA